MDEIISQIPQIIEPIPTVVPKKKLSIWLWLILIIFIVLFSIILKQQQLLNTNKQEINETITPTAEPTIEPTQPLASPVVESTPKISKINENYFLFKNEELKVSFEYRTSWGSPKLFWNGMPGTKYLMGIEFPDIPNEEDNTTLIFSATNPLAEPPGRGGFWGDEGWLLKNEDDLKKICPENNESCKIYKNKNNITVVKKYELVNYWQGDKAFKSNQYYLYNPNSLYSGIVISDERIRTTIFPDVVKEVEDLVDSLRFIK